MSTPPRSWNLCLINLKKKDKLDGEVSGKVNTTVKTPIGNVTVKANPEAMKEMEDDIDMKIVKSTVVKTRENCLKLLNVDIESKDASILYVDYTDISKERADSIIYTIFQVYEENWLRDKNQSIVNSSDFINERIQKIENDLGLVESDISHFKSKNMMPDIVESVKISMENANMAEQASGFGDSDTGKFMDEMLSKADPDYASNPDIKWNFTKFLIDRKGRVVARFEPVVTPDELEAQIESLL